MIKQPNAWSCYPTAAAICTGLPLEVIMSKLRHDGSQIMNTDKADPWGRASFTSAEMSFALLQLGFALVIVNAATNLPNYPSFDEITDFMMKYNCILTIQRSEGCLHALAWNGVGIYDPKTSERVSWSDVTSIVYIEAVIKL